MCPEIPSESSNQSYLKLLISRIIQELLGIQYAKTSAIKVNTENLTYNGELCVTLNLNAWRGYVSKDYILKYNNILKYYAYSRKKWAENENDDELLEKAIKSLIILSNEWPLRITKCSLRNERMFVFLDRPNVITIVIKSAIQHGRHYGSKQSLDSKTFNLKIDPDRESDLTYARLRLVKDVSENILRSQGHGISEKDCHYNYILTAKSKGKVADDFSRYVCGVVRNAESNIKEVSLTWESYFNKKMEKLSEISAHKFLDTDDRQIPENFLRNITDGVIVFEMLSVKPSRTVSIRNTTDSGATFILYNTARIAAICRKYDEKHSAAEYPKLLDINQIDFSVLNQEEEWSLVYNFILAYPEVVENSIKYEPSLEFCPQHICSFLFRLCQLFSIYYRKTRILVEGYPHLISTVMARLYLLKALEIVLQNSLKILNVNPVLRM